METSNTIEDSKDLTNTVRPMNIVWLQTIYEDIIKNPDLIVEAPLRGTDFVCPVINAEFCLQARKTSDSVLSISCNRKLLYSTTGVDEGYFLRLYFTITGLQLGAISAVMRSNQNSVTVNYETSIFSDSPSQKYYVSTIKCVIRMIETSELPGEHLEELETMFQSFTKGLSKSQLKNMAHLLKRPKLKGVFTGRESTEIFLIKLSFVERSLPFSKQLVRYIQAKGELEPDIANLPLGEILCQINCGEKRTITEGECITLYRNTIRVGLNFLHVVVSDYIISHLNNDFSLDVLKAADTVNDGKLFKAAAIFFLANRSEILQSDKWKILVNSTPNSYARSIIHKIKLNYNSSLPFDWYF